MKFRTRNLIYLAPLQFPDPTPLNTTGSKTDGNDLSPSNNKTYYDNNLIHLVGPLLIHDQFADQVDIPMNHGTKMEFRGFEPLPKAMTPLTEGVTPTGKRPLFVCVNGVSKKIPRGKTVMVPPEFAAAIENAMNQEEDAIRYQDAMAYKDPDAN